MLQYLAPTLQLIIGVYVYNESVSGAEMFGFASIWLALGIFAFDTIRASRAAQA
jgi:chloramphenicol-sensitive protein RarD